MQAPGSQRECQISSEGSPLKLVTVFCVSVKVWRDVEISKISPLGQ